MAALQEIVAHSTVAGATARLEVAGEFLPLTQSPASEALFAAYRDAAKDAGLDVAGEFSGGCADSGFTAAVGCPTLCSTGAVGGNAHTPEEYLEIELAGATRPGPGARHPPPAASMKRDSDNAPFLSCRDLFPASSQALAPAFVLRWIPATPASSPGQASAGMTWNRALAP